MVFFFSFFFWIQKAPDTNILIELPAKVGIPQQDNKLNYILVLGMDLPAPWDPSSCTSSKRQIVVVIEVDQLGGLTRRDSPYI